VSELLEVSLFTIGIAALATLLIMPPGVLLGWLLARKEWPGKTLVETLVGLPLVIPPVATGLILLKLLGRNGPFGDLFASWNIEIVFTWKGVLVATMVMSLPLMVRSARVAIEEVDRGLEEAAAMLGARPLDRFWTITLPLARRGLLAGCVLSFARALGEFGATVVLAGMIPGRTVTLALGIYQQIQLGDDHAALGMLCVSLVLAFGSVWLGNRLSSRRTRP
jgi:molybdate transport system permease protein